MEDPAEVDGTEEEKHRAFSSVFMTLRTRVSLFVNLPLEKLDKLSLQEELRSIAKQRG